MPVDPEYILQAKGISKRFGGVQALIDVDFKLRPGEVLAVTGENGTGKTTLMNIFGGIVRKDKGVILLNGDQVEINSPLEAFEKGISTIHQELTMMPHLSVMENIFIGHLRKFRSPSGYFINRKLLLDSAKSAMATIELSVDPHRLVKDLSISEQQEIEIIKALSGDARIIIMDEPNSSLTDAETKRLFNIIGKLKKRGISIVYVSHKIEEVLHIADRITVLRDGRLIGTMESNEATAALLFKMIAGREKKKTLARKDHPMDHVLLRVDGLCGKGFKDISFDLFRGEVLGFYGLVGSGRSELARGIFGANPLRSGSIVLEKQSVLIESPKKAIEHGISMVPEDRKEQALFMNLPVRLNMTISHLPKLSRLSLLIKSKHEKSIINEYVQQLHIKLNEIKQPINTLSGGNQQKAVLARCLMIHPKILILDEPTHGVDIGAKEEVHHMIEQCVSRGMGIIYISSEMPEIMSVSDRIAVFHEGQMAGIFTRKEVTEDKLIAYATGYKYDTPE